MQEFVPTTTQYPNFLFDLMPSLKEGELRLLNAIVRKTYGWHKQRDKISLSQMIELTGMSKQGVLDARERLINKKIIKAEMVNGVTEYMVIVPDDLPVNKVDVNKKEVVQIEQTASLNQTQVDVHNVDIQKKVLQNKNTKEREREESLPKIQKQDEDPFDPVPFHLKPKISNDGFTYSEEGAKLVIDFFEEYYQREFGKSSGNIRNQKTDASKLYGFLSWPDKIAELTELVLQFEYSWHGHKCLLAKKADSPFKATPTKIIEQWEKLVPTNVPYYIREGFKTENECLSARRKKAEEKKEESKPNIDWQALKKKEEERVKQVLAILGETQEMVNGTN